MRYRIIIRKRNLEDVTVGRPLPINCDGYTFDGDCYYYFYRC